MWCEQPVHVGEYGAAVVHCVFDCLALSEEREGLGRSAKQRCLTEVFRDKGIIAIAEGIARKMASGKATN